MSWPPAGHDRQRELFDRGSCPRCEGGNGSLCSACEAEIADNTEDT
jgi:hypothetical protein